MHSVQVIHTNGKGSSYYECNNWDAIYQFLLAEIVRTNTKVDGRNGDYYKVITHTTADLRVSFPLSGLRKLPISKYIDEIIFDVNKDNHIDNLKSAKVFWKGYAHQEGFLGGSGYNRQWRMWPPSKSQCEIVGERLESNYNVDQLMNIINGLIKDPKSRRNVAITYNPTCLNAICPPCHIAMVFNPEWSENPKKKFLDVMVPARSNDMILGFPGDIVRYAAILMMVAQKTGFTPRYVTIPSINSHVYATNLNVAKELTIRDCTPNTQLEINNHDKEFNELSSEDFKLIGYEPNELIKNIKRN